MLEPEAMENTDELERVSIDLCIREKCVTAVVRAINWNGWWEHDWMWCRRPINSDLWKQLSVCSLFLSRSKLVVTRLYTHRRFWRLINGEEIISAKYAHTTGVWSGNDLLSCFFGTSKQHVRNVMWEHTFSLCVLV